MKWLAIGRHNDDGRWCIEEYGTARAATKAGRYCVETGHWRRFRVARVTAMYTRGGGAAVKGDFWRHVSWCIGDEHANRIWWLVRAYCKIAGINPNRLDRQSPR